VTDILFLNLIIPDGSSVRRHKILPRLPGHHVDLDGGEESVDGLRVVSVEDGASLQTRSRERTD
jgi:hypothetical protein